jgi:hypothetical protein
MVQRRRQLRFALETVARIGIRELVGQELDRDRPLQLGVDGAEHHANPALADNRVQLVRAEKCAWSKVQGVAILPERGAGRGRNFGRIGQSFL